MTEENINESNCTMKNNETIGNVLSIEVFLDEHYAFRHNVLNGKTEFAKKAEDGSVEEYRVLTQKALNSIVIQAKREDVFEEGGSKSDIQEYINSEEVESYDPIKDYLNGLPQWDGKNHVAKLFSRLPGISSEQLNFLTIWMRSTVAHWLQLDTDHGNECVPTLIGAQGCGKTTFLRRLLPQHLREYYLDHLNLSNKFDKEMALSNNLLVNLDELEAIRPSQHAQLKQTLSKSKVNGRPIYGASQEDRPRYASFVATTNNPHPLTDPTGSMHELQEDEAPYWFHNDEVARIQQLNQEYMEVKDMSELVEICFRKPNEGEQAKPMSGKEMLKVIQGKYPSLEINHSAKMQLSTAMKELGYESKEVHHSAQYYAIPLAA